MAVATDSGAAAAAAQAASAAQLGEWRATFEPAKKGRLILATGGLLVIFGGIAVLAAIGLLRGGTVSTAAVVAGLVLVIGVLAVPLGWVLATSPLLSAKARACKFYVHDGGFVRVTRHGPEAYRWDGVRTVHQRITRVYVNGIDTGVQYRFQLDFADGRRLKLTNYSTDMANFGPVVQQEIARWHFPSAWAALAAGQKIPFGRLTLSASDVVAGRKPPLPWSKVRDVQMFRGYLRIFQAGQRRPYIVVAGWKVPNLYLVLALAERLRSGTS